MQKLSRTTKTEIPRPHIERFTKYQPRLFLKSSITQEQKPQRRVFTMDRSYTKYCIQKYDRNIIKSLNDKPYDFVQFEKSWGERLLEWITEKTEKNCCQIFNDLLISPRAHAYASGFGIGILSGLVSSSIVKNIPYRWMPYGSLGCFLLSLVLSEKSNDTGVDGVAGFMFFWGCRIATVAFPVASFHIGCLLCIGLVAIGINCLLSTPSLPKKIEHMDEEDKCYDHIPPSLLKECEYIYTEVDC